jgi:hypothetical protein
MAGRRLPCDVQVGHAGTRRSNPELIEDLLYLLARPFYLGLDATLRKITHPTAET